jgi:hypothetical protein
LAALPVKTESGCDVTGLLHRYVGAIWSVAKIARPTCPDKTGTVFALR